VLLIALWVRSYSWMDEVIRVTNSNISKCYGCEGQIVFSGTNDAQSASAYASMMGEGWHLQTQSVDQLHQNSAPLAGRRIFRAFHLYPNQFVVPFWAAILIATTLGALVWIKKIRWRFSLRTLLIATTLVAVVLGLMLWHWRGGRRASCPAKRSLNSPVGHFHCTIRRVSYDDWRRHR